MYAALAELVRRRSGIKLAVDNPELIDDKLAPVARLFGFRDVRALLKEMTHPPEELAQAVTEAMTTRDTSFFRDPAAFDCFERMILPAILDARASSRRLRVWCCGVATGQEAYSVAMILDRFRLASAGWKTELLATDLSFDAITRARRGTYTNFEVERGLTSPLLSTYFTAEESAWRVSDRLRRMVSFRPFNLLDDFGWLGQLDVIFCRNVLFYLEPKARAVAMPKLWGRWHPTAIFSSARRTRASISRCRSRRCHTSAAFFPNLARPRVRHCAPSHKTKNSRSIFQPLQ